MIKNIPNKYSKELLRERIDHNFQGKYDFFYLPIDLKNNCNLGYAFINFISLESIEKFVEDFHMKKWPRFNSDKICKIQYARIQGKKQCEKHFKNSTVMKHSETRYKPYISKIKNNQI